MNSSEREKELREEGWTPQFTTCEPRLSEAVELYRSLGFEVLLEPLAKAPRNGECRICLEADPDRYRTIYTRKARGKEGD